MQAQMQTRKMGTKHVPVYSLKAITIKDPKNFHEEIYYLRVKHWKEGMRTEIDFRIYIPICIQVSF